jgi:general stress protein 26
MTNDADIRDKFWKAIRSDKTVMLGLADAEDGLAHPMTAQFMDDQKTGPIWFITARDSDLVRALHGSQRARAYFAAKGHGLFASIEGELAANNDRAVLDKLWNPYVEAWFTGGKDDPNLQMLSFDPDRAQVWLNENSVFAGVRLMLGRDPKRDYADKTAELRL